MAARKRKLSAKQGKEIFNIGIAFGTGLLASQVQEFIEKHSTTLKDNPAISSSILGALGSGMVFFGSDKLNPAGYALIGASGYDMADDVATTVLQGVTRIASPMQGVTRIGSPMQGVTRIVDAEAEEEMDI